MTNWLKMWKKKQHEKVNSLYNGHTALHAACQNGHMNVIEMLVKHNADLELEVSEETKR